MPDNELSALIPLYCLKSVAKSVNIQANQSLSAAVYSIFKYWSGDPLKAILPEAWDIPNAVNPRTYLKLEGLLVIPLVSKNASMLVIPRAINVSGAADGPKNVAYQLFPVGDPFGYKNLV